MIPVGDSISASLFRYNKHTLRDPSKDHPPRLVNAVAGLTRDVGEQFD